MEARRGWPLLLGLVLVLGFIVAVPLLLAPDENNCEPGLAGTGTLAGATGSSRWSEEQRATAKAIVEAAAALSVGQRGQAIGLMVALGESGLRPSATNGPYLGIFQQDAGWGSEPERRDPKAAATSFFRRLLGVDGWQQMEPTLAGHAVQRNADPQFYAPKWTEAVSLLQDLSAPAANAAPLTSAMFSSKTWSLELRHSDRDVEISPDKLAGFTDPQFYGPAPGGGLRFTTPALKPGSGGSSNPRTELKEYIGGKRATWDGKQGVHNMTITQTVTKLPKSGMVVVGQIHDEPDDVTVIRLEGDTLYATYDDETHFAKLMVGYQLGTPFTVSITSQADGIHVSSGRVSVTVPHPRSGKGYYFKAGMYPQGVTDNPGGVGEVIIHSLSVTHNGQTSTFNGGGEGAQQCICPAPQQAGSNMTSTATLRGVSESSALAMSRKHPNIAYTVGDETNGSKPFLYAVDVTTGNVVGRTTIPDVDDTESLAVDGKGRVWIGNLGNNHGNAAGLSVVVLDEPGRTSGPAKNMQRFPVHYSDAEPNVEAMTVHPATGEISLFTRNESGPGKRYTLTLGDGVATATPASGSFPKMTTDATYSWDGNKVFIRHGSGVDVYAAANWTKIGTVTVPKAQKGESITADSNGTILVGEDSKGDSPLHRVLLSGVGGTPQLTSAEGGGDCSSSGDGQMLAFSGGTWDGGPCIPTPEGAPADCGQALKRAAEISERSACKAIANRGGNWDNRCGEFVANVYGYRNSGEATALSHYRSLKAAKLTQTGEPPPGALVFFTSSQPAGHVAVYAGGGKAWSNDYVRNGCIDLTPMTQMAAGGEYLGWAYPSFPKGSRL